MRAASGWPATSPASGPDDGSSISKSFPSIYAIVAALRREPGARKPVSASAHAAGASSHTKWRAAVHDHQLRVGQLPLKAVGAGHGRELVVLAPEQERGHAQRGEVVALELREVAGAVQLELAPRGASRRRSPSSTRAIASSVIPVLDWRITAAKPSRSMPAISCSPVPGSRSALAMPCHLPFGKKPVELITSARTASGCSHAQRSPTRPPQSWTTSTHALDAELASGSARPTRCGAPRCPADPAPSPRSRRSPVPRRASRRPRSAGITSLHMNDDSGKPCRSRTTGASAGPLSRYESPAATI